MHNLRVELNTVDSALRVVHCSNRTYRAFCNDGETCRNFSDSVGVAHPAGSVFRNTFENLGRLDSNLSSSILSCVCRGNSTAKSICSELSSVTDSKNRDAKFKNTCIYTRSIFSINTCRTAGKDNTGVVSCLNLIKRYGTRLYFAEDISFADATGN